MDKLLDDRGIAERVLDHIARGTTDLGADIWREPVENYVSEDRLRAEMALLRRLPVAFCPSASLPEAGSYVAREAAGIPILAVRGADGVVRAFRNACRHRGMQVASGAGCVKALACRYHGWTYRLDGSLSHVPHEVGFPGLDKSAHGLVPVRAVEQSGLVLVTQEDTPAAGGDPADSLPALVAPGQRVFATAERDVDANWKIVAEGFLEGYHIRATHRDTFYPYGFDNLNVVETFGRNSRVTFPFRRIEKLAKVPAAQRRVEGLLTFVYHLFPNVMVAVLSQHTKVVVLEPLALGRTRLVTYALAEAGDASRQDSVARDADFVDQTGAAEDREVTCAIQRGIASGANRHFLYGRFESAIVHFHRTLTTLLGRSNTPTA